MKKAEGGPKSHRNVHRAKKKPENLAIGLLEDASHHAKQVRYVVEASILKLRTDLADNRREMAKLRKAVLNATVLMTQILDDPDARRHAEAVLKDYRISHFKRDEK